MIMTVITILEMRTTNVQFLEALKVLTLDAVKLEYLE